MNITNMQYEIDALFLLDINKWQLTKLKQRLNKCSDIIDSTHFFYCGNKMFLSHKLKEILKKYFEELRIVREILIQQVESIIEEEEYASSHYNSPEEEILRTQEILDLLRC